MRTLVQGFYLNGFIKCLDFQSERSRRDDGGMVGGDGRLGAMKREKNGRRATMRSRKRDADRTADSFGANFEATGWERAMPVRKRDDSGMRTFAEGGG